MAGLVEGKVILVSGAGGGIGGATAALLAREGAALVLTDISAEALAGVAEDAVRAGAEVLTVASDVADSASAESVVAAAVARFGRLDGAFNNAGVNGSQVGASGAFLADWSEESFERLMRINLTGVFLAMKAQIRQMLAQGHGAIVNTGSVTCFSGMKATSGYAASKHGVLALTEGAALEYAPTLRVNCVCPGFVDTGMLRYTMSKRGPEILAKIPMGRLAQGADVAETVCWLLSDRAGYVTGAAYPVDGGYLAG